MNFRNCDHLVSGSELSKTSTGNKRLSWCSVYDSMKSKELTRNPCHRIWGSLAEDYRRMIPFAGICYHISMKGRQMHDLSVCNIITKLTCLEKNIYKHVLKNKYCKLYLSLHAQRNARLTHSQCHCILCISLEKIRMPFCMLRSSTRVRVKYKWKRRQSAFFDVEMMKRLRYCSRPGFLVKLQTWDLNESGDERTTSLRIVDLIYEKRCAVILVPWMAWLHTFGLAR